MERNVSACLQFGPEHSICSSILDCIGRDFFSKRSLIFLDFSYMFTLHHQVLNHICNLLLAGDFHLTTPPTSSTHLLQRKRSRKKSTSKLKYDYATMLLFLQLRDSFSLKRGPDEHSFQFLRNWYEICPKLMSN